MKYLLSLLSVLTVMANIGVHSALADGKTEAGVELVEATEVVIEAVRSGDAEVLLAWMNRNPSDKLSRIAFSLDGLSGALTVEALLSAVKAKPEGVFSKAVAGVLQQMRKTKKLQTNSKLALADDAIRDIMASVTLPQTVTGSSAQPKTPTTTAMQTVGLSATDKSQTYAAQVLSFMKKRIQDGALTFESQAAQSEFEQRMVTLSTDIAQMMQRKLLPTDSKNGDTAAPGPSSCLAMGKDALDNLARIYEEAKKQFGSFSGVKRADLSKLHAAFVRGTNAVLFSGKASDADAEVRKCLLSGAANDPSYSNCPYLPGGEVCAARGVPGKTAVSAGVK
ncbi:hypothetical protein HZA26_03125 [Candidatus Nomurabacteria bacterium]|nr:hypothetical protein [Candidatus Nomurabacteria bacterium]